MTYQHRRESDEQRVLRLKREAAELALARRHAEAGEVISGPELEAWLDCLDQEVPLPVPKLPAPT
jgi:hypothetical protein